MNDVHLTIPVEQGILPTELALVQDVLRTVKSDIPPEGVVNVLVGQGASVRNSVL